MDSNMLYKGLTYSNAMAIIATAIRADVEMDLEHALRLVGKEVKEWENETSKNP